MLNTDYLCTSPDRCLAAPDGEAWYQRLHAAPTMLAGTRRQTCKESRTRMSSLVTTVALRSYDPGCTSAMRAVA
jgi:hypothetical protein